MGCAVCYGAELGTYRGATMSEHGPNPSEPIVLEPPTTWQVTRRACQACHKVLALVHAPGVESFPCPRCGGETIAAAGPDALTRG